MEGSWGQKCSKFVKKNIVMIVMVPMLVSIHWGWVKLQNVDQFVPAHERRELPLLSGIKVIEEKLTPTPSPKETENK